MKDPVLVIFMRTDLNMSRGKIAVQAGHAVALTMFRTEVEVIEGWMLNNQIKIVLSVDTLLELGAIAGRAEANGVPWTYVQDAGSTEVDPGTTTCLAVGIESRRRLLKLTEGWKALK